MRLDLRAAVFTVLACAGCSSETVAPAAPGGGGSSSSGGASSPAGAGGISTGGDGGEASGASGAGVTTGGSGGAAAGGAAGSGGGAGCIEGTVGSCYEGPNLTLGVGVCTAGARTCTSGGTFGACEGQVVPSDEVCNALDDDCDGSMDEALTGGACDGADSDLCTEGTLTCTAGGAACSDATGDDVEACDWSDNDCNGLVDDLESSTWDVSTADSVGSVGIASAFRFDAADGLHVAYYDAGAKSLKYVHRDGAGAWDAPVEIDSSVNVAPAVALAVGLDGTLHVAYRNDSTQDLRYAMRPPGGTWAAEPVDEAGNTGDDPAIAVDSTGLVHISYRDNGRKVLRHAWGGAGTWSTEDVDTAGNAGKASAIVIDASDNVHVTYYRVTEADLIYAYRTAGPTGAWETPVVVDAEGDSGSSSSIAIDGCGGVHVSYYRDIVPARDLRYAKKAVGGGWTSGEVIDMASNAYGSASSIGVEPLGAAHIAFVDSQNKRLMYAKRVDEGWALAPLDSATEVSGGVSLHMDAGGHVGATFYDAANKDLLFASSCAGLDASSAAGDACYEGPDGTLGVGICVAGQRVCTSSGALGTCEGQVLPSSEVCNTLDDDCDGSADEQLTRWCDGPDSDACNEGTTTCNAGVEICSDTTGDDAAPPTACVQRVSFEMDPAASDIDIGWTGYTHNAPWVTGAVLTMCAAECDSATAPFGTCNLKGPIANVEQTNSQRCRDDPTKTCASCADCGGGACVHYFGSPVPWRVSGFQTCLVTDVDGPALSQMDIEGGTASIDTLNLRVRVYNSGCPRCEGDPSANDRQAGGTCSAGGRAGQPCDAGGWSSAYDSWTSLDCPPEPFGAPLFTTIPLSVGPMTSAGVTWTLDAGSESCTVEPDTRAFCAGTKRPNNCSYIECVEDSSGEGYCGANASNVDWFCEGSTWGPGVFCSGSCSSDHGWGTCTATERSCFPDNGLIGGSIHAAGEAATMSQGDLTMRLGSVFCVPTAHHPGVMDAVGIPGPGRISATMKVKVLGPSP